MEIKAMGGMILAYFFVICSVIVYVENRIKTDIQYIELEKVTGFSLAHIRDIFVQNTGKSLSRYILERKILNAAFEISHTKENLLTIVYECLSGYCRFPRTVQNAHDRNYCRRTH